MHFPSRRPGSAEPGTLVAHPLCGPTSELVAKGMMGCRTSQLLPELLPSLTKSTMLWENALVHQKISHSHWFNKKYTDRQVARQEV